jgi:hypothetical protein
MSGYGGQGRKPSAHWPEPCTDPDTESYLAAEAAERESQAYTRRLMEAGEPWREPDAARSHARAWLRLGLAPEQEEENHNRAIWGDRAAPRLGS